MRILYILSGTDIKGGATKSFINMAKAVETAGNEIYVLVPNDRGITPILRKMGWTIKVIPYEFCSSPSVRWNLRDALKFFPRIIKAIALNKVAGEKAVDFAREAGIEIVHDNTSVTNIGHIVARALDLPHVIHVREYGWKDFRLILPGLRKRLKAANTYVVAITDELAKFRSKGLDKANIRVIYNGVIDSELPPYFDHKDRFWLYAGRVETAKGVDDLVWAYVEYARVMMASGHKPIILKIAGNYRQGGTHSRLMKIIKAAGLSDSVEFLGEIDDVDSYYAHAVATVIPSRKEGFGRIMPEAISEGSLCIVRNSGGLKEQLSNGERVFGEPIGLGFDTNDELSRILVSVHKEYEVGDSFRLGGKYYRMIEAGRHTVSQLYTCEANAKAILELYGEIKASK